MRSQEKRDWRGCEESHLQWKQSLRALVDQPVGVQWFVFLSAYLSMGRSRTLPSFVFPIFPVANGATHHRTGIPVRRDIKYCTLKNTFTGIFLQCPVKNKKLTCYKFIH